MINYHFRSYDRNPFAPKTFTKLEMVNTSMRLHLTIYDKSNIGMSKARDLSVRLVTQPLFPNFWFISTLNHCDYVKKQKAGGSLIGVRILMR